MYSGFLLVSTLPLLLVVFAFAIAWVRAERRVLSLERGLHYEHHERTQRLELAVEDLAAQMDQLQESQESLGRRIEASRYITT